MNVLDFMRGLGSSVASNNPVTMAVDTGANIADLGIAAAGYLGHKAGMLTADQLPSPLDKSKIPGSSAWLDKQAGVNDSTEATVGSLAGMFVNPGKAISKVIVPTRKLPGGEAAAKILESLKRKAANDPKAKKVYETALKAQRTSYVDAVKDFATYIPDDPKLLNIKKFEELRRNGGKAKLIDLYDNRQLKKIVPQEFWEMEVEVTPNLSKGSGAFAAGLNFAKTRQLPNGEYAVVMPTGLLPDKSGKRTWSAPTKQEAQEAAKSLLLSQGHGRYGTLKIGAGSDAKEATDIFFHELQHAASTWYKENKGGDPKWIGDKIADYVLAQDELDSLKKQASLAAEIANARKAGLSFDDYIDIKGLDVDVEDASEAYRLWDLADQFIEDSKGNVNKGLDWFVDTNKKMFDNANNQIMEDTLNRVGPLTPTDMGRISKIRSYRDTLGDAEADRELNRFAFEVYQRMHDENLARTNELLARQPWQDVTDIQQYFSQKGPSIVVPNVTGPSFATDPLLKGDPQLFFDPKTFGM